MNKMPKKLSDDIQKKLDIYAKKIRSGEIKPIEMFETNPEIEKQIKEIRQDFNKPACNRCPDCPNNMYA